MLHDGRLAIKRLCAQIRKKIDPEFKAQNPPQNVLAMSAGYAVYMASSSNLRYQVHTNIRNAHLSVAVDSDGQIATLLNKTKHITSDAASRCHGNVLKDR